MTKRQIILYSFLTIFFTLIGCSVIVAVNIFFISVAVVTMLLAWYAYAGAYYFHEKERKEMNDILDNS